MPVPVKGQPHPDVAIVRDALTQLTPGQQATYDQVAAALGMNPKDPAFARRCKTARDQLRREGINISVVPGVGFIRETGEQSLCRHAGRERKAICRKARRAGESLANIKIADLPEEKRPEYFAERTINNVIYQASGAASKQKFLAAAKVSPDVIPMQKALEVLKNGNKE